MGRTKTTPTYHACQPPTKTQHEPEEKLLDTGEEVEDVAEMEDKSIIPKVVSFMDSPLLLVPRADPLANQRLPGPSHFWCIIFKRGHDQGLSAQDRATNQVSNFLKTWVLLSEFLVLFLPHSSRISLGPDEFPCSYSG